MLRQYRPESEKISDALVNSARSTPSILNGCGHSKGSEWPRHRRFKKQEGRSRGRMLSCDHCWCSVVSLRNKHKNTCNHKLAIFPQVKSSAATNSHLLRPSCNRPMNSYIPYTPLAELDPGTVKTLNSGTKEDDLETERLSTPGPNTPGTIPEAHQSGCDTGIGQFSWCEDAATLIADLGDHPNIRDVRSQLGCDSESTCMVKICQFSSYLTKSSSELWKPRDSIRGYVPRYLPCYGARKDRKMHVYLHDKTTSRNDFLKRQRTDMSGCSR